MEELAQLDLQRLSLATSSAQDQFQVVPFSAMEDGPSKLSRRGSFSFDIYVAVATAYALPLGCRFISQGLECRTLERPWSFTTTVTTSAMPLNGAFHREATAASRPCTQHTNALPPRCRSSGLIHLLKIGANEHGPSPSWTWSSPRASETAPATRAQQLALLTTAAASTTASTRPTDRLSRFSRTRFKPTERRRFASSALHGLT